MLQILSKDNTTLAQSLTGTSGSMRQKNAIMIRATCTGDSDLKETAEDHKSTVGSSLAGHHTQEHQ